MFKKILIANRGEIACRVIKTAKRMGIQTVAVYSDADANAQHVLQADEAIYIGAAPAKQSYLDVEKILNAAKQTQADAVHPGYGFLSENATFARACEQANIVFIGPPASAIEAMGSKSAAKQIMQKAGVPLIPGYHGDDQSEAVLRKHSDDMGYPVLLKAAAGGGGKGMRQVWQAQEFSEALAAAKRESMASFSDDKMLVEKYLQSPRHVELQVFCDSHGNGVYLFERDCSIQRRHQKVIEEAPAPGMADTLRASMGEAAVKAAAAIGYQGAGTVEFLLDSQGEFYFMEMNTRLQVEHPVTEMITGQDLVEWQFTVASGQPLPCSQGELTLSGHAMEARIYAEDADNDFMPSTGTITLLRTPAENAQVRIDTGVVEGDSVSVYYDPMIAKLIVWAEDREKAAAKLVSALRQYQLAGVTTNIDYLCRIADSAPFKQAALSTHFIDDHQALLQNNDTCTDIQKVQATCVMALSQLAPCRQVNKATQSTQSPYALLPHWRMNQTKVKHMHFVMADKACAAILAINASAGESEAMALKVQLNQTDYACRVVKHDENYQIWIDNHQSNLTVSQQHNHYQAFSATQTFSFDYEPPSLGEESSGAGNQHFVAPMNGTLVTAMVEAGDKVEKGQTLLVMEAMKMEHSIQAPEDGFVTEIFYQAGDLVDGGAQLLAFEPSSNQSEQ